jgi:hypothetical protein
MELDDKIMRDFVFLRADGEQRQKMTEANSDSK